MAFLPLFYPTLFLFMVSVSYAVSQIIWFGIAALIPILTRRDEDNGQA